MPQNYTSEFNKEDCTSPYTVNQDSEYNLSFLLPLKLD